MKKFISITASVILFAILFSAPVAVNAQGGMQGVAPKKPAKLSPDTFFFVMPVQHAGSDGTIKGIELFGPTTVYEGGIAFIANLHQSPLVVTVCDRETGESLMGTIGSGDVLEMPIEDDPRTEGHQFLLKVETIGEFTAQLFLTTQ